MSDTQLEEKPKKSRTRRKNEQVEAVLPSEETVVAKEENSQEVKPVARIKFDVYCSIKKVPMDHIGGMAAFKGAKKLLLSLLEWDEHFKGY